MNAPFRRRESVARRSFKVALIRRNIYRKPGKGSSLSLVPKKLKEQLASFVGAMKLQKNVHTQSVSQ